MYSATLSHCLFFSSEQKREKSDPNLVKSLEKCVFVHLFGCSSQGDGGCCEIFVFLHRFLKMLVYLFGCIFLVASHRRRGCCADVICLNIALIWSYNLPQPMP